MNDRIDINDVIATFVSIHAIVISELDRQGALSAAEVLEKLQSFADLREAAGANGDVVLIKAVIEMVQGPPPASWTPTVIPGDKS